MAKSKAADFSSFVRSKKDEAPAAVRAVNASDQKLVACRVTRPQWERLQQLCITEDTSVQAVVSEALSLWFKRRGLPW
jgi:hypothetical protein